MKRAKPRILFASAHCLTDISSGAAVATLDGLKLLAARGFECRAFCAAKTDSSSERSALRGQQSEARLQQLAIGRQRSVRVNHFNVGGVSVTVFPTRSTRIDEWLPGEPAAMRAAFERVAGDFRADVLLTDPKT